MKLLLQKYLYNKTKLNFEKPLLLQLFQRNCF